MSIRVKKQCLLIAMFLSLFIALLDMSIISVALTAIQRSMKTDLSGLQWVTDAYVLCLSCLMLTGGVLGDRFGRKRFWLIGVAFFTIGSAICGFSSTITMLLIGRVVQGISAALLMPGTMSMIVQAYPEPRERAKIIGWWGMFGSLGTALGPVLSGVLINFLGWHSIFWINIPLGIITLILGAVSANESSDPEQTSLDPAGQIFSIVWIGSLSFALITGRGYGWLSPVAFISLGIAVIAFIIFVRVEMKQPKPMLPIRMFSDKNFAIPNAASFVIGFGSFAVSLYISLYLQQIHGYSVMSAGLRLLPLCAAETIVAVFAGQLTSKMGPRLPMLIGYFSMGIGLLGMCFFEANTNYALIAVFTVINGLGIGFALPSTTVALLSSVPRERSGMASATINAMRQTGVALGVAVIGSIISSGALNSLSSALFPYHLSASENAKAAQAIWASNGSSVPAAIPASLDSIEKLYKSAFLSGYHMSTLVIGLVTVAMAVVIIRLKSK